MVFWHFIPHWLICPLSPQSTISKVWEECENVSSVLSHFKQYNGPNILKGTRNTYNPTHHTHLHTHAKTHTQTNLRCTHRMVSRDKLSWNWAMSSDALVMWLKLPALWGGSVDPLNVSTLPHTCWVLSLPCRAQSWDLFSIHSLEFPKGYQT